MGGQDRLGRHAMKEDYKSQPIDEEDAFNFIIRYIRDGIKSKYPTYGYDLYLPNTIRSYLELVHDVPDREAERHLEALSPPFYTAAWELCRRGILRHGIKAYRRQSTEEGNAGNGYSLTLRGKDWIQESGQYELLLIIDSRRCERTELCIENPV